MYNEKEKSSGSYGNGSAGEDTHIAELSLDLMVWGHGVN